jgi:hypothetical protein
VKSAFLSQPGFKGPFIFVETKALYSWM